MFSLIFTTALAPIIWGTTYYLTTEFLPPNQPFLASAIRCLPAGLVLLILFREKVDMVTLKRLFILSMLNIALFQSMLFISAYTLPGGVASLITSLQPAIIIFLAFIFKGETLESRKKLMLITAFIGMCCIFLTPQTQLNTIGVLAAFIGALSMSFGTFFSREWSTQINIYAFTGYQLTFGGIVLLLVSPFFDIYPDSIELKNIYGYGYLVVFGAIISYSLWFNGIKKLPLGIVTPLGFLSPITAIILGWLALEQSMNLVQGFGIFLVLVSLYGLVSSGKNKIKINAQQENQ
ncbi:DMT family transporter [Vibrio alginolyticus]|uniref:DMT family transporter n=1 Tax=Vibrio alginolyticus TaxID=663 RepID=UPI002160E61F|nr:DMT family transporter [Vibrio alginolyticus]MCS0172330.1 DMT family transporter [Vibrio alginolyticus]